MCTDGVLTARQVLSESPTDLRDVGRAVGSSKTSIPVGRLDEV